MGQHVLEVSTPVFRLLQDKAALSVSCSDEKPGPTQRIVVNDSLYNEVIDYAIDHRKSIDQVFLEACR